MSSPVSIATHTLKRTLTLRLAVASLLLIGSTVSNWASTINPTNHYAYGANVGWLDWRGDADHGAVIGEYVCSGYLWSANVGWIHLGSGAPTNGVRY